MTFAILADIHANLEALTAVLGDLDAVGPDAVVSLGDNVGYGPDPQAVCDILRRRNIPGVLGNHEEALRQGTRRGWFNPSVEASLILTPALLDAPTRQRLIGLPRFLVQNGLRFVHGMPPANPRAYLFKFNDDQLRRVLSRYPERLAFVGHTHDLAGVSHDGRDIRRFAPAEGRIRLDPAARHIVNVGSVGQPRDGDPRAAYALWREADNELEIRRVAYDAAATRAKLKALGFPAVYADRLG